MKRVIITIIILLSVCVVSAQSTSHLTCEEKALYQEFLAEKVASKEFKKTLMGKVLYKVSEKKRVLLHVLTSLYENKDTVYDTFCQDNSDCKIQRIRLVQWKVDTLVYRMEVRQQAGSPVVEVRHNTFFGGTCIEMGFFVFLSDGLLFFAQVHRNDTLVFSGDCLSCSEDTSLIKKKVYKYHLTDYCSNSPMQDSPPLPHILSTLPCIDFRNPWCESYQTYIADLLRAL